MSSSDSEDDCYGNVAKKLLSLKSKYVEKAESIDTSASVDTSTLADSKTAENISGLTNVSLNSTENDELSLDAIIAQNPVRKPGRKRKAADNTCANTSKRETRSSKRKTGNSSRGRNKGCADTSSQDIPVPVAPPQAVQTPVTPQIPSQSCDLSTPLSNRRNRGRGRGRVRRGNSTRGRARPSYINPFYPIYSIGNTDEYPDMCGNQQLFSTAQPKDNDVEIIDLEPLNEDNEELSVKVYWQNSEIFKFKIRKYQKITQIFEYFATKENVSNDKLLFTYNDRILKIDDTPEDIDYNIAKFIDGGIVQQNVTQLIQQSKNEAKDNGIRIKFQCQNKKKPYETTVRPEDSLGLAMMKCAEEFSMPLDKLKFYFDGDLISAKSTPNGLELEGGECIDVKLS